MSERLPFFDAAALTALRRVTEVAASPDGTWLAVSVARRTDDGAKYVSDLWRVALDSADSPVALTRGMSNDRAPSFRSDGSLCFLSNRNPRDGKPDEGDDERAQVWMLPARGGEPQPLTDEPLGVIAFKLAARAERMIVLAPVLPGVAHESQRARAAEIKAKGPSALRYTRLPARHWDHWLPAAATHVIAYEAAGAGRVDLTPTAERDFAIEPDFDVSADGRAVVITRARPGPGRIDDGDLHWIEIATGRPRDFGATPRRMVAHPRISPDGASIACTVHDRRDDVHGVPGVWLFELATGEGRPLCPALDDWPRDIAWTADGQSVVFTIDDRGDVPVMSVDVATREVVRITRRESGGSHEAIVCGRIRDEVVGIRHRWSHPPEPFRVKRAPGTEPEIVARLSGFDPRVAEDHVAWSSHETESEPGVRVQWFVARPAETSGIDRRPTLHWIHGGPRHQWADGWHWRWNVIAAVAQGYAVVLPNPRGSTGFGAEYMEGLWRNRWGDTCFRDLMRVADEVDRQPWCDSSRVGAMGGSFGGYMVNWFAGNTTRFRALVSHAGIFSFRGLLAAGDHPAWWRHEMGADPFDDPEAYGKYSPDRRIDRWKTPTLVIHGANDFRCPLSEALALFEALQSRGVASELVVFPDENHWILKPRNTLAWYESVFDFLRRHMESEAAR